MYSMDISNIVLLIQGMLLAKPLLTIHNEYYQQVGSITLYVLPVSDPLPHYQNQTLAQTQQRSNLIG